MVYTQKVSIVRVKSRWLADILRLWSAGLRGYEDVLRQAARQTFVIIYTISNAPFCNPRKSQPRDRCLHNAVFGIPKHGKS